MVEEQLRAMNEQLTEALAGMIHPTLVDKIVSNHRWPDELPVGDSGITYRDVRRALEALSGSSDDWLEQKIAPFRAEVARLLGL